MDLTDIVIRLFLMLSGGVTVIFVVSYAASKRRKPKPAADGQNGEGSGFVFRPDLALGSMDYDKVKYFDTSKAATNVRLTKSVEPPPPPPAAPRVTKTVDAPRRFVVVNESSGGRRHELRDTYGSFSTINDYSARKSG